MAPEKHKVKVAGALARLPGPQGERFAEVLKHHSLAVEIYTSRASTSSLRRRFKCSRRASRIRAERFSRARLTAPFAARSKSESNTTWMVSLLGSVLHT